MRQKIQFLTELNYQKLIEHTDWLLQFTGSMKGLAFNLRKFFGYRQRWQISGLFARRYISTAPLVVIGGCGSSGTTLLRRMLDRHPEIHCGPESTVFLARISSPAEIAGRFGFDPAVLTRLRDDSRSQAEFIDRFREFCLAASGKRLWADKTPENIRRFDFVKKHFPNAKLIHVVRDGRDTVCSLRTRAWMKLGHGSNLDVIRHCARYWARRAGAGLRFAGRPDYMELRYEALTHQPETELRRVMDFLGLDWDPAMLQADPGASQREARPIYDSALGRWRKELSSTEVNIILREAGMMLAELGYLDARAAVPPRFGQRLAIELQAILGAAFDWQAALAAKLAVAAFAAAYWLLPRNIMSGRLDDLAISMAGAAMILWLTPPEVRDWHRYLAAGRLIRDPGGAVE
jgi:protein-tyrosine sulfotransferase